MEPESRAVKVFIDDQLNVYEGKEAAARLAAKAPRAIDPKRGITQVDMPRWQEAQSYERRIWMVKGRALSTARNEHHRERFANYSVLRGMKFARGIELGCGPFTNMRVILEYCRVDEIFLLDPLMNPYQKHPYCQYRHGRLAGLLNCRVWPSPQDKHHPTAWLRKKIYDYRIGGVRGRPITIQSSMVETYQVDVRFDLVVIINVLEHCQDANRLFGKIETMLETGGVLVFGERVYRARDVKNLQRRFYDAGHPLRVDRSVVEAFLARSFEPLMRAEYLSQEEFRGLRWRNHELYFIGRKTF